MGISLEQYRDTVGKFCSKHQSYRFGCLWRCYLNFTLNLLSYVNLVNVFEVFVHISLMIILLLLVLAGDIETNPGPSSDREESNNISICHINIRSLKPKFDGILYKMEMIRHDIAQYYNIITLSETWLNDSDDLDNFRIDGYQKPFFRNRDQIGGGVLCWVADNIAAQRRLDLEVNEIEALWLEVRENVHKFLLCVAYRPPSCTDFWSHLQNSVDKIYVDGDVHSKILLIGDFNSDFNTLQGQRLSNFATVNNLSMLIYQPTRITNTTSSILDQCLTNFPNYVKESGVEPPIADNDHCSIYVKLHFKVKKSKCYSKTMWDFSTANTFEFRNSFTSFDWDSLVKEDINETCRLFTEKILHSAREFIPHKLVTVRTFDKPFYNGYLRRLRRKVNCLHQKVKHTKTPQSWDFYKHERNFYFREVARCKNEYNNKVYSKIDDNINQSSFFKLVKSCFKTTNTSMPPILSSNGDILTDDTSKANAFNIFFSEASKLNQAGSSLPVDDSPLNNTLETITVSEEEVQDQIRFLNANKSYGPDGISPRFIKLADYSLVKPLTKLYNLSLSSGKVPKLWKQANVVPLHKKDSKHVMGNYRPVSLLSILGKLLERIVFKHVYNHFRDNFLLSVWQSGFLPGSSTVTQLIELYDKFCTAVSQNKEIRIVFLDISKAFDRVWHKGLIFKLKKWGISGTLLHWFEDYLKDRVQRVIINGQFSSWTDITAGVPQGSVLGPLLFLVFINDITNVVTDCHLRLFADDTCLFIEVDNRQQSAVLINKDLENIQKWSTDWLVTFNASKTESMVIGLKQNKGAHPKLYLHDTPVTEVSKHKHIGLWIENNLSWHEHISDISTKAEKRLNLLKQMKFKLSRKTLEKLYFCFVRPILEYGDVVWHGASHSDLNKLDIIQVQALRLVSGAPFRSNIDSLYNELGWQNLHERRQQHILVMMFKIINNYAPEYLTSLIPPLVGNRTSYQLRNRGDIQVPAFRIKCHQNSFFPVGIKLWNELDISFKQANTLSSFKSLLRKRNFSGNVKQLKLKQKIYCLGDRYWNVIHSKMRMNCSFLKDHLANQLHVIENSTCDCGGSVESNSHFLLECILYNQQRQSMLNKLQGFGLITTELLLFGDLNLSFEQNKIIFAAVQVFLMESGRFS